MLTALGRVGIGVERPVSTSKSDQLRRVLEDDRGKSLVILISGHPDPDAIASAMAHQRICERFEIAASIAHVLPIARPDNRAMVKLLNARLLQIASGDELARFDALALVDTATTESTVDLPAGLRLTTVVDHHRVTTPIDAPFVDIRPSVGATASIYAEYFEQGVAPLDANSRDDVRVATALLLGIQTDTDDFALASSADFRAAAFLRERCDSGILARVGHRVVAPEIMDVIGLALADLVVIREFAVAGVGRLQANHRDAIPAAADFILRRGDIDTVLVFGIVEDRIDGSLRTNSPSLDPTVFLEAAFGRDASGRPYGGGRADKGAFQIPLGILAETTDDAALWRMVAELVGARLARIVPELRQRA